MAKFNHIQNTFISGQISKKFRGRTDLKEYGNSAEKIENFIPIKEGGVTRRPGSRFIAKEAVLDRAPGFLSQFNRGMAWSNGTVSTAADTISDSAAVGHVFNTGDQVQVTNPSGSLPSPLTVSTTFFVIRVDSDTVKLATTLANAEAGTAINLTTTGSGTKAMNFTAGTKRQFDNSRLIPFSFNNKESYVMVLNFASFPYFVIFRNDGEERLLDFGTNWGSITADQTAVAATFERFKPTLDNYRLQFVQAGDVIYFTYNDDDTDESIKPFIIYRIPTARVFADSEVTVGTDTISPLTNGKHNLIQGDIIEFFNTSGALPGGIVAGQEYHVIKTDADGFKIALTAADAVAGTAVDITSAAGGGVHKFISKTSSDFFLDDYLEPSLSVGIGLNGATLNGFSKHAFIDRNVATTTFTPSATTGAGITITSSVSIFTRRMVRSYIRIVQGSSEGVAQITAVGSANEPNTTCTATVIIDFTNTTASDNWTLSAWNGEFGFPRVVDLFEGRLLFAASRRDFDTTWGTLIANRFHMMEERLLQDKLSDQEDLDSASDSSGINYFGGRSKSDPFSMTVESQEINKIQWLSSGQDLQIGTLGSEYMANGGDENVLHPGFNILKRQHTRHGSNFVQARRMEAATIFVSRDGRSVRNFFFSAEQRTYVSQEMTALFDGISEHKFDSTSSFNGVEVIDFAYQESRKTLWVLTSRKTLVGFTADREFGIKAWHVHDFGGANGSTHVKVHGITSIPSPDGTFDDLWVVVERTVNSATATYLEKMGDTFEHSLLDNDSTNDDDLPWLTDSAVRVTSGSAITVFSGFSHLIGETVQVLADGLVHPDLVVNGSGQITLTRSATEVIAGLKYTSTLKTFPIEAGGQLGTSQGQKKRIDRVFVKLFKTFGGKIGKDENSLKKIQFLNPADPMGGPLSMFTGDKRIEHISTPDEEAAVTIVQDQPLPMTVLALIARGVTYD